MRRRAVIASATTIRKIERQNGGRRSLHVSDKPQFIWDSLVNAAINPRVPPRHVSRSLFAIRDRGLMAEFHWQGGRGEPDRWLSDAANGGRRRGRRRDGPSRFEPASRTAQASRDLGCEGMIAGNKGA
jgi:hypothetical protein